MKTCCPSCECKVTSEDYDEDTDTYECPNSDCRTEFPAI